MKIESKEQALRALGTTRAFFDGDSDTILAIIQWLESLPPLPEKPKPPTIGERVANVVFSTYLSKAEIAKLIDDAIAEDREGGQ